MGFISFVPHVGISNTKNSKTINICPRAMVLVAEAADPGLNKLLVSSDFYKVLGDLNLKDKEIYLPHSPSFYELSHDHSSSGTLTCLDQEICSYDLDVSNGEKYHSSKIIASYDESIQKYHCLEGVAYYVCHSMVIMAPDYKSYVPAGYLTFDFYTNAQEVTLDTSFKYCDGNIESQFADDINSVKVKFLVENVPNNAILLIDGPLIAGDYSNTHMMASATTFSERGIIPVFFVKNSSSNLVIDNVRDLSKKYNSDLHWAFKKLNGSDGINGRTSFFKYNDKANPRNSKIFCYLKAFGNASPQRVEFHLPIFEEYSSDINNIMDMIFYLLLAQGNSSNPQVRPIAVAEKYAQESLSVFNIKKMVEKASLLQPTMNQGRGYA